ncbi:MAG: M28 family peptidase [Acidobacteria bacterium]|nr:M28 family peptidase [Acidobacteriota bacterium]
MRRSHAALVALALAAVPTLVTADATRWWSHVEYLADDALEGRDTGTAGYRKAAEYVAARFEAAGLKPAGTSGFFQLVTFRSRRILEDQSSLAIVRSAPLPSPSRGGNAFDSRAADLVEPVLLGEDANISMGVEPAPSVEGRVVFVGYGLAIPELKIDDLAGFDLRGKIVFYLTGGPPGVPAPVLSHAQRPGVRWTALRKAGAIGTISVQNPRFMDRPWERATLSRLQWSMSLADRSFDETAGQQISISVNPRRADKFLAGSGHTFADILALADAGKPLPRFVAPLSIRVKVRVDTSEPESPNVIGLLPGTDPRLKTEYVILSAHLDHTGVGTPINGDAIYNGAMDNASGSAALIEVAETIHETGRSFKRSLLFVALTAEEKGQLGSRYFANSPTVDASAIVANVNVDMFLPILPFKHLLVLGLDESDLGPLVRQVVEPLGVRVQRDPEPERNRLTRSDQYNFIRRGIPAVALKIGYKRGSKENEIVRQWLAERYHAPSDDVNQPIDLEAAGAFNRVFLHVAEAIANRPERPKWNEQSFFRRFATTR